MMYISTYRELFFNRVPSSRVSWTDIWPLTLNFLSIYSSICTPVTGALKKALKKLFKIKAGLHPGFSELCPELAISCQAPGQGPVGIWCGVRAQCWYLPVKIFPLPNTCLRYKGVFYSFKFVGNLHLTFHFRLLVVLNQLFPNEFWSGTGGDLLLFQSDQNYKYCRGCLEIWKNWRVYCIVKFKTKKQA